MAEADRVAPFAENREIEYLRRELDRVQFSEAKRRDRIQYVSFFASAAAAIIASVAVFGFSYFQDRADFGLNALQVASESRAEINRLELEIRRLQERYSDLSGEIAVLTKRAELFEAESQKLQLILESFR